MTDSDTQWALEFVGQFSQAWRLFGGLHFFSACCWWCPAVTQDTRPPQKTPRAQLQAHRAGRTQAMTRVGTVDIAGQSQAITRVGTVDIAGWSQAMIRVGTVDMTVAMEESPSPLYLLWAGSGTTSPPRTWWPSGSWSAGSANSVSPVHWEPILSSDSSNTAQNKYFNHEHELV